MSSTPIIQSAYELITSREQTRAGFIEAALAKNEKARPYIEQAKTLRVYASSVSNPNELTNITEIREALLTASGLSDKAFKYFTDDDKTEAIKTLIKKFLVPAGDNFVDELTYRYLLIKGDTLGGSMRNYVGIIAQMKLVRKMLSILSMRGIPYSILFNSDLKKNGWQEEDYEADFIRANDIKSIAWDIDNKSRLLFFNTKIPLVNKGVDICLYEGSSTDFNAGSIVNIPSKAIMLGELKGGIDPAGADEHWKTGNTALQRIRNAFKGYNIHTSFIAAAIETNMAFEIFEQLRAGTLSCAINITVDSQLTEYCDWIIKL